MHWEIGYFDELAATPDALLADQHGVASRLSQSWLVYAGANNCFKRVYFAAATFAAEFQMA